MAFYRIMSSTFWRGIASGRGIALIFLGVTTITAGYVGMMIDQASFRTYYSSALGENEDSYAFPVYVLTPGTAHTQIWNAINYRFLRSVPSLGGPLFPMRYVCLWMAFIIPLIALLLTFDSISAELESGVFRSLMGSPISRQTVLAGKLAGHVLTAVSTLLVGLLIGLLIVVKFMDLSWTVEQISRLVMFFVAMGVYATAFAFIGMLLSISCRRSARSMWVCIIILAGLFGSHILTENIAGMAPWDVSQTPEMSSEVKQYLHQASLLGRRAPEPPDFVVEYMDALEAHSATIYASVRERYSNERWLNFVSPSHWLLEMGNQLLQDQYSSITDTFKALSAEEFGGRASSNLRNLLPEMAWMVVVLSGLAIAVTRSMRRLEV